MRLLLPLLLALSVTVPARAQTLTVADRTTSHTYSMQELLTHKAARNITIANDIAYRGPRAYRAIPVSELLKDLKVGADDYVQARATDNFSIGIPADLFASNSNAAAFVAIENPAARWPIMPGKKESAGPLYVVWQGTPVSTEYWAYKLAALIVGDSPFKRWPVLAVSADVPAGDRVRRGLDRFAAVCMACHRFKGAGEGTQGPDLGQPMNPVQYFQPDALKKFIRNPQLLRIWPEQKMPGFGADTLPDSDVEAIVAWLQYKALQKSR